MKRLLKRTAWLYKYGLAIVLFISFLLSLFNHLYGYIGFYEYANEMIGYSLFFCYREMYSIYFGFSSEKGLFQKAVVWALTVTCIFNLLFIGNYEDTYIDITRIAGIGSFFTVSAFLIYKVKIKLWLKKLTKL